MVQFGWDGLEPEHTAQDIKEGKTDSMMSAEGGWALYIPAKNDITLLVKC